MLNTKENPVYVTKANGIKEVFNIEKLKHSLLNSGASEEAAQRVADHVLGSLHEGMTTTDIYRHAFEMLRELNKPIAHSYSLRRAVMQLGPSGFAFEDLVAEIMKGKGYETMTRQTVLGQCVPHEIDVVAWDKEKLIMVEAKYHNDLGTKSDLKVALYVKARIDDLKANAFSYGGRDRKLDEGWLVTNTKFSTTAIHYGACQNLVMIGWNYPEKGNLQDMIMENEHVLGLVLKHASIPL